MSARGSSRSAAKQRKEIWDLLDPRSSGSVALRNLQTAVKAKQDVRRNLGLSCDSSDAALLAELSEVLGLKSANKSQLVKMDAFMERFAVSVGGRASPAAKSKGAAGTAASSEEAVAAAAAPSLPPKGPSTPTAASPKQESSSSSPRANPRSPTTTSPSFAQSLIESAAAADASAKAAPRPTPPTAITATLASAAKQVVGQESKTKPLKPPPPPRNELEMLGGQEGGGRRGDGAAGRNEGKRVAGGVIDIDGARNMDRRSLRVIFDDIDTKKRGYINVGIFCSVCVCVCVHVVCVCVCVMMCLCVVYGEVGGRIEVKQ